MAGDRRPRSVKADERATFSSRRSTRATFDIVLCSRARVWQTAHERVAVTPSARRQLRMTSSRWATLVDERDLRERCQTMANVLATPCAPIRKAAPSNRRSSFFGMTSDDHCWSNRRSGPVEATSETTDWGSRRSPPCPVFSSCSWFLCSWFLVTRAREDKKLRNVPPSLTKIAPPSLTCRVTSCAGVTL
jgi:hypothetical protein